MTKTNLPVSVLDWVQKAEHDFLTVKHILMTENPELSEIICFHAQQCIEKYLKAVIELSDETPPKTHSLGELWTSVLKTVPEWENWSLKDLNDLTMGAVEYRYPGESPDWQEATYFYNYCSNIRQIIREYLNLPTEPPR